MTADIKPIRDGWAKGSGRGQVKTFIPSGRSASIIYVVSVKAQPGVTKVGRTARSWRSRRAEYANWNLADGDGIDQERAFIVTEEFVDLNALERALLDWLPFSVRHGREWFNADFDEVCRLTDQFLCETGLSYE